MPTISSFLGVLIRMYYEDHTPPHVHARAGGKEAVFDIKTGKVLMGRIDKKKEELVRVWILLRRAELMEDWKNARQGKKTLQNRSAHLSV